MKKPEPASYPCFSSDALHQEGMLLHLSTACNMQCRYCASETGTGLGWQTQRLGMTILTAGAAADIVERRIRNGEPPAIIEIGGPGESLMLADTYALLRELRTSYPDISLSLWTNGLLLPDRLDDLVRSGLSRITLSLPAATPETAAAIYDSVSYRGKNYSARKAAELVLQQQWNGLSNAVEAGLAVTVYAARIRGVNEHELELVGTRAKEIGAERVIIVPVNA